MLWRTHACMTPAEFAAARTTLGLSPEQVALSYGEPVRRVRGWEDGSARIPERVAGDLRWKAALERERQIMAASGLSTCPTATDATERIHAAFSERRYEDATRIADEMRAHVSSCATCQARNAFAVANVPPTVLPPTTRPQRIMDWVMRRAERGPRWLLPVDDRGQGRFVGFWSAAVLSTLVAGGCGVVWVIWLAAALLHGQLPSLAALRILVIPIPVAACYFAGFWLAGAAYDALRPIRDTLPGRALLGGVMATAVYGAVSVMMTMFDSSSKLSELPILLGAFAALGAVVGAGHWVWTRVKQRFPWLGRSLD